MEHANLRHRPLQRGGNARRYKRARCCPHGPLSFVITRVGQEQSIRAIEKRLIKSLRPKENSDFQQRRRQMAQAALGLWPPRRRPPKGGRAQPESGAPPRQATLPEYMMPARDESRQHQQAGWNPVKCSLPGEAAVVSISSLKYNGANVDAVSKWAHRHQVPREVATGSGISSGPETSSHSLASLSTPAP